MGVGIGMDTLRSEILEMIERVSKLKCDSHNERCSRPRHRDKDSPCPGAKSVEIGVQNAATAQEIKNNIDALSCASSIFGHIITRWEGG